MNYIDYIILAVVLIGFLLGFKDGIVRKIIGILGLVFGVILALQFASQAGKLIAPVLNNDIYLSEIVAGILIFLATLAITAVIKRLIHPMDKVNKFVNQILGGIAGAFQIVFFLSAFFLILNLFRVPSKTDVSNSLLYSKTYSIIPMSVDLILGSNSKARKLIENMIQGNRIEIPDSDIDTLKNL